MSASSKPPRTFQIDAVKVSAYLLNPDHPVGGSKATFFIAHGFSADQPGELVDALLGHSQTAPLVGAAHNGYVEQFVYEGALVGPHGAIPRIRPVWKVEAGGTVGILVTAYPY